MADVVGIHRKRFFTLAEARDLLPIVRRVTSKAYDEVGKLTQQHRYCSDPKVKKETEEKNRAVFAEWTRKVRTLGCEAKGSWLVDFDSGEGYYCWRFPEAELLHFHGYDEGFQGRVPIH